LEFVIVTGLGKLQATLVYSYIGEMLTGGARLLVTVLLILFALTILIFLVKQLYNERQSKKSTNVE
jgi:uncharacterized membrane protein YdjX (TVP38/TMEM64 family)